MTKDDLQAKVDALKWYHRIELPHGIVTPGWAPFAPENYRIPDDLTGKRVLDVGAWDGYWTFEAAKRGAAHIFAIDDFSNTIHDGEVRSWAQFDLCVDALGQNQCARSELSVYDICAPFDAADAMWNIDVVFFFGVLYHLRHPLFALENLRDVMAPGGLLCVESAILDDFSPYRGNPALGGGGYGTDMVMEFYPAAQYGGNQTNWWVPTLKCLANMVASCGFEDITAWKIDKPDQVAMCRGYLQARKA